LTVLYNTSIGVNLTVLSLGFTNGVLLSGNSNGTIGFWNASSYANMGSVAVASSGTVMAIVGCGANCVAAASGNNVYIVLMSSMTLVASFTGHTSKVNCLGFVAGQLFSGSIDTTVRIWNATTGSLMGSKTFPFTVNALLLLNISG
jgi:WD40 repeat protein